jgi:hypothetical protein
MHRVTFTLIFASLGLLAQVNTGAISGYVFDPSGKTIPGALVTLENTASSLVRSMQTNAVGHYEFEGLPPAEYRVSESAPSFARLVTQPVQIEVDQRTRLDLHATLAPRGESVVVNARTSETSNEPGELGAVLDQTLIDGLPLNERDFLQLA